MGLRNQIAGGLNQLQGVLARDTMATVAGRSFPVVVSAIDRTKTVEVDGFMVQESAPFVVKKKNLGSHTVTTLQGQLLMFENLSFRIVQVIDNGLSFTLRCVAKDQSK